MPGFRAVCCLIHDYRYGVVHEVVIDRKIRAALSNLATWSRYAVSRRAAEVIIMPTTEEQPFVLVSSTTRMLVSTVRNICFKWWRVSTTTTTSAPPIVLPRMMNGAYRYDRTMTPLCIGATWAVSIRMMNPCFVGKPPFIYRCSTQYLYRSIHRFFSGRVSVGVYFCQCGRYGTHVGAIQFHGVSVLFKNNDEGAPNVWLFTSHFTS